MPFRKVECEGGLPIGKYILQTVDRTLDLLLLMSAERREWGVLELADRSGVASPTVHRMLQTLAAKRFVYQNPLTQKYGLGTAILRLSQAVTYRSEFVKFVMPFVEALHHEVNELVHLNIREGDERVCVAAFTAPHEVNVASPVGQRNLLNGGCSSKVLLAFEPDDWIEGYLARHELPKYTDATVTDPQLLRDQIRGIRANGYCITAGERAPGVYSVGAPLFDMSGQIVASVTCTLPQSRCSPERLKELTSVVTRAAANISGHLGYTQGPDVTEA